MADTGPHVAAPDSPRGNHSLPRGRRRAGPGGEMNGSENGNLRGSGFRGRNDRSGRGRGRGRGQLNHERIPSLKGIQQSNGTRPAGFSSPGDDRGTLPTGLVRTDAGREQQPPSTTESAVDDSAESDVCFICASPIEHTAIAPCNHQTCHICSLRLRALYKTRACAHCRVSQLWMLSK